MKNIIKQSIFLSSIASAAAFAASFDVVKEMQDRPGNLAVASNGDVYTTIHPMEGLDTKVVRIEKNGDMTPLTNAYFSKTNSNMHNVGIADAIGIFITKNDVLWVLDMGGVIGERRASVRFVAWDLKKNQLERIVNIPTDVLHANSFAQDFAIDEVNDFVYIADMTAGSLGNGMDVPAIVAYNLKTGESKRLLEASNFMKAQKPLMAEGKTVLRGPEKVEGRMGLNPITIDAKNEWVYFGTMAEGDVFRIKASDLSNFNLTNAELEKRVQKYSYKPHSDGFKIDEKNIIYVGDVNNNGVGIVKNKKYSHYIKDETLVWVDGLFVANDGYVYATVNQLNRHANLNGEGVEKGVKPYKIIKFKKAE